MGKQLYFPIVDLVLVSINCKLVLAVFSHLRGQKFVLVRFGTLLSFISHLGYLFKPSCIPETAGDPCHLTPGALFLLSSL